VNLVANSAAGPSPTWCDVRDLVVLLWAAAARMDEESAVFAQRLQTDEAREAFKAFAERRQPDFVKLAS
jgi:hypothetical protein